MSVWAWGSNKNCSLGIGNRVRTGYPARVGDPAAPAVEETAAAQPKGGRGRRTGAAVGAAARLFEGEIRREAEDAALDDERLRPEHRKQLEAAAGGAPAAPRNELSARTVVSVACGEQHTLCADAMGFCFSWGRTREGQLGHGGQPTNVPCPFPRRIEPLSSVRIRRVAAGAYSSMAITAQSQLYCFGLRYRENAEGKVQFFGVGDFNALSETHQKMIAESHFRYLDGPAEQSEPEPEPESQNGVEEGVPEEADETDDDDETVASRGGTRGMVSAFEGGGADAAAVPTEAVSGQKRPSFERRSEFTPYLVGPGSWDDVDEEGWSRSCEVLDIAGGYCFSMAVIRRYATAAAEPEAAAAAAGGKLEPRCRHEVYGWGINDKGQLGLGHRWIVDTPERLTALDGCEVVHVACGQQHAVAVTAGADCFSWGLGVFGQLGHGTTKDSLRPQLIRRNEALASGVVQVACGSNHTVFRTQDGKLQACGHSEYGQQGVLEVDEAQEDTHVVTRPTAIRGMPPVGQDGSGRATAIACGWLHTMAITANGALHTFGWGSAGVLGHRSSGMDGGFAWRGLGEVGRVTAFRSEKVVMASGGWKHCAALLESSEGSFASDFAPLLKQRPSTEESADQELPSTDLKLRFGVGAGGTAERSLDAHAALVFARCPRLHLLAAQARIPAGMVVRIRKRINERFFGGEAVHGDVASPSDTCGADRMAGVGTVTQILAMGTRVQVTLQAGGDVVWVDVRDLDPVDGRVSQTSYWDFEFPRLSDGSQVRAVCGEILLHFIYTDTLPLETGSHLAKELGAIGAALGLERLRVLAALLLPSHRRPKDLDLSASAHAARSSFSEDLRAMMEGPTRHGADVCLRLVSDETGIEEVVTLWTHRCVLATRSAYFRKLFSTAVGAAVATNSQPADSGSGDNVVTLRLTDFDLPTQFDPETFHDIVRFCYTNGDDSASRAAAGGGFVSPHNATRLLVAADALMMESLKQRCESEIEFHFLDEENAAQLLELCDMMSQQFAPRLALACRQLLQK